MLLVTTESGSTYLIKQDERRALRMKGIEANRITTDEAWFPYERLLSWSEDDNAYTVADVVALDRRGPVSGQRMLFWGTPTIYAYSTTVTQIEPMP